MAMTAADSQLTYRNASVDAVDLELIAALRVNGRITSEELARRVSLSRPAVVARLKRLEQSGVIAGFTVVTDWELLGYSILAFVRVRTSNHCRETAHFITAMHDPSIVIEECHRTTGEWCLLVKIRARSSLALEAFLDRIRDEANVQATMTTLALSTLSPSASSR